MFGGNRKARRSAPALSAEGRDGAAQAPAARLNPSLWPQEPHAVLGSPLLPPYPPGVELAIFGMGCFWGAERIFWQLPGIHVTAAGYAGGQVPNPTYEQVCNGRTLHAEVVLVVFRPNEIAYEELLRCFWESHDPTQGMRQGNDVGSQYRSLLVCLNERQLAQMDVSRAAYQQALQESGMSIITTEVIQMPSEAGELPPGAFYFAEPYHQQYLAKNPGGYCGLGGTGVSCPRPAQPSAG